MYDKISDRLDYIVCLSNQTMTRWSKGETKFTVNVNPNANGEGGMSYVCRIPKPIIEMLGIPNSLSFVMKNGKVIVENGDDKYSHITSTQKRGKK